MNRKGVTLLEILLVVAVIAILAALSVPLWRNMLESEKVTRAGDIIRAEIGATRVNAIRESTEYVFCYIPETGQFWNEPLSNTTTLSSPVLADAPTSKVSLPPSNSLPQGVTFMQGEVQESTRSMDAEEDSAASTNCTRIIFYPDGSGQNASIKITNEYEDIIQITVRGITGTTSVSDFITD